MGLKDLYGCFLLKARFCACTHSLTYIYTLSEMPDMQPHHVVHCSVTVLSLEGEVEIRHTTDSWVFMMAEKPQTFRISEIP